jgi:hypothetical protein
MQVSAASFLPTLHPTVDSPLADYRRKAQLEQAVIDFDLADTILRPTLLFKQLAILTDVAWYAVRSRFNGGMAKPLAGRGPDGGLKARYR